ncbi:Basic leucine zipper transcriptional factor ATF-like 3 [Anabarilius grahami]|uniref:Basic leucine zipper transcriptional factor ATF-like 3 n=1 Tax=Anabarilius grahami TaxID=495550 RepID=A0A3N0XTL1_ANAGA|nr:Basic leucine zipper transcriptional factor ATF-like 3 [Anabarilius grahami]
MQAFSSDLTVDEQSVFLEMPAAVMDNFELGSPFSQSDSQSPQDWSTQSDGHTYHRREKNRNAARKSRRKQTEKADTLHEELQSLEQSNAAIRKEIAELEKELEMYTTALEQHEPHCTKPCPYGQSVGVPAGPSTATPFTLDSNFVPELNPFPDLTSLPDTNSVDLPLTGLLDCSDWSPWDTLNGNGCLQQF